MLSISRSVAAERRAPGTVRDARHSSSRFRAPCVSRRGADELPMAIIAAGNCSAISTSVPAGYSSRRRMIEVGSTPYSPARGTAMCAGCSALSTSSGCATNATRRGSPSISDQVRAPAASPCELLPASDSDENRCRIGHRVGRQCAPTRIIARSEPTDDGLGDTAEHCPRNTTATVCRHADDAVIRAVDGSEDGRHRRSVGESADFDRARKAPSGDLVEIVARAHRTKRLRRSPAAHCRRSVRRARSQ